MIAALGVVSLAWAAWFIYGYVPREEEAALERNASALGLRAEGKGYAIDRWVEDRLEDLRSVEAAAVEGEGRSPADARLLTKNARLHRFSGLGVLGPSLAVVASMEGWESETACLETAKEALAGRAGVDLHWHESGRAVAAFAVPIREGGAPGARIVGAVLGEEDPERWLFPMLRLGHGTERSGEDVLMLWEEPLALYLSPLRYQTVLPRSFRRPLVAPENLWFPLARGKAGFGEFLDYRRTRVLAASRRLTSAPWGVVAMEDANTALAPFFGRARTTAAAGAALFVAALAMGWGIRRLEKSERAMALAHKFLLTNYEVGGAIIKARDESGLLAETCRILVDKGGFLMVWIGVVDEARGAVTPLARAGKRTDFLDDVVHRCDGSEETAPPTCEVVRTGRYAIRADLGEEPRFESWRQKALACGFRSTAAFPLRFRGAPAGAITVYSAQTWRMGDDETGLLEKLAEDLSYALGVLADREELRKIERARAQSDVLYRNLFESNPHAMWVYDRETTRVLAVNDTAMNRYGYSREEFLGMKLEDLCLPEDRDWVRRNVRELAGEVRNVGVTTHVRKDGSRLEVDVTTHDLVFEGREARLVLALDVTERLKAEEALRHTEEQLLHAQKMEAIGQLAGGVAHDFNNLLTVIQGYGEVLMSSYASDDPRLESTNEILKAANRASSLTGQLLAFSRKQILKPRLIRLDVVVSDLEKMLRRIIGEDIDLIVVRPQVLAPVKADPGQIEQVLMNLVVNARDAMPKGGRLTVEVEDVTLDAPLSMAQETVPVGVWVTLAVSDTGVGMDPDTLSRAFEPFFTTKEPGKGTGLGLATVYGIVKQSGGYIEVRSAPGEGTSIRVFLPAAEGRISGAETPVVKVPGGGETILVVEDEESVRTLVCKHLRNVGYKVLTAASAEEAMLLPKTNGGRIDLLMTDVVMPGEGGLDLAKRLSAVCPGLKILLMSGYTPDAATYQAAVDAGWHYLQKPFSQVVLQRAVREAMFGSGSNLAVGN